MSAITLVQDSVTELLTGATSPFTVTPPPTPGNFVWLSIVTWNGAPTSVTDNQGNTYVQAFAATVVSTGVVIRRAPPQVCGATTPPT